MYKYNKNKMKKKKHYYKRWTKIKMFDKVKECAID